MHFHHLLLLFFFPFSIESGVIDSFYFFLLFLYVGVKMG